MRIAKQIGWLTLAMASLVYAQAGSSPEQKIFDDLFGAKVKAARTSKLKLEVSKEMLAAAGETTDQPKILIILCNQTHSLTATFRDGYETAATAMALLIKHVPAERDAAMTKLLAIRLRQYNGATRAKKLEAGDAYITALTEAGDAKIEAGSLSEAASHYGRARSTARTIRSDRLEQIQGMVDWLAGQQKLAQLIKGLKAQLKANPKNEAVSKKLLSILIGEASEPAEARKYSFLADEELKPVLTIATTPEADRAPKDSLLLGKWYQRRAKVADKAYKADLYKRARASIQDYLDRGPKSGAGTAVASLLIRAITQDLEKLADSGPRPRKTTIQFLADKSMKLFPAGTSQGSFPKQQLDDPRGPFVGKGIFFRQNNSQDKDVYYAISSAKTVRSIYYKGAATRRFTMEILDTQGRVLATLSSPGKGNVWDEYTLKVPPKAGRKFILHFHNVVSTWFYIDKIELR